MGRHHGNEDEEQGSTSGRRRSGSPTRRKHHTFARYNQNGHEVTKGIHPDGESGRRFINPWKFLKICARSSSRVSAAVNILWPFVPPAIALHFVFAAREDEPLYQHKWVFSLNYIAMVPTANLLGFAGQELARKLPKVFGVVIETFLGSIVEIVLFMVLLAFNDPLTDNYIPVIQAAILGSILANLLLCLGACFFIGGMKEKSQKFKPEISETGSGLMLMAAFGLVIPRAFAFGVTEVIPNETQAQLQPLLNQVSRATAIILLIAFLTYVFFQTRSHHGFFEDIFEEDEKRDRDRHKDLRKEKLTMTECLLAIAIAVALMSLHAVFLVQEIEFIIRDGVSDAFMGLILVPLVEKLAEHLTAIDEAYDNQMNFALAHVLGATIQTALLNTPLVVIVGWGLGKNMDLDFSAFQVILLVLTILVVGSFLRDGESNYLEGALCVMIYIIIAVATWYFPNAEHTGSGEGPVEGPVAAGGAEGGHKMMARAVEMMFRA